MRRALLALALSGCTLFEPPLPSDASMASDTSSDPDATSDPDAASDLDAFVAMDTGVDAPMGDAGTDAYAPDAPRGDAGLVRRPTLAACAFGAITVTGTLGDPMLDEVSGLAASRRHPHVLWAIEDSGSAAVVHAISDQGRLLATYRVAGSAVDYEDIAIGPGPDGSVDYLYIADIGDNDGSRTSITVYRAPEPDVAWDQVRVTGNLDHVEPLPMTYPDGYRDNAEALFVDPATEDVYLVSKNGFTRPNTLFRLAAPHTAAVSRVLEPLGATFAGDGTDIAVTAADISADGLRIVIRAYHAVNVWTRVPGVSIADTVLTTLPCAGPVANEMKGESITFTTTGYFGTSEGSAAPIWFVPFAP